MTGIKSDTIVEIDALVEVRFELELLKQSSIDDFKNAEAALKKGHTEELALLQGRIDQIDSELYSKITDSRSQLISKGKQSFATLVAKFQFKKAPEGFKVLDATGVMEVARRLRIVRKIADPVNAYKLNRKKFNTWMKKHPEYREMFDDYLDDAPVADHLTIQPNATYVVVHDDKRISPPSVSIKQSP